MNLGPRAGQPRQGRRIRRRELLCRDHFVEQLLEGRIQGFSLVHINAAIFSTSATGLGSFLLQYAAQNKDGFLLRGNQLLQIRLGGNQFGLLGFKGVANGCELAFDFVG